MKSDEEQNREYWARLRKGDKEALFGLYNNTYFHLVRFGLRMTANDELVKDCVTQLFLQLWDKHSRLNEVNEVKSYLFTSLKRSLLDQLEYRSKTAEAVTGFSETLEAEELSYEEIIIRGQRDEEVRRKLQWAIAQLSPRQTELIRLMFFEGLTYDEITLKTSQSIKTAYNTIYSAICMLRKMLK